MITFARSSPRCLRISGTWSRLTTPSVTSLRPTVFRSKRFRAFRRILKQRFQTSGDRRDLPSFPTRRSSDLQAALGPVLDAIRGTTDTDQLQALAQAVQALPVELTAEEAPAALGPILAERARLGEEARCSR